MLKIGLGIIFSAIALFAAEDARAALIYDESISGDFSNDRLNPTALSFSLGANQIKGTAGRSVAGGPIDRDYFTFTVPTGVNLTAIIVRPGTATDGALDVAFIGLGAGTQISVVAAGATSAAGLLGFSHYSDSEIGVNILPEMGGAVAVAAGASGFIPPLGPGAYSIWLQELAVGPSPYVFDFVLEAPEPGSGTIAIGGLLAFLFLRHRAVLRKATIHDRNVLAI